MSAPALQEFEQITAVPPRPAVQQVGGTFVEGDGTFPEDAGASALFIPWHWTEIFKAAKVHGAGRWAIAVVLTHARCSTHQNCRRDKCDGGKWLVLWAERWAGRLAGVSKNTVGDAKRKMISAGWFRVHQEGDHTKHEADVIDVSKLVLSTSNRKRRKSNRPQAADVDTEFWPEGCHASKGIKEIFILARDRGVLTMPNQLSYEFGGKKWVGKLAMLDALANDRALYDAVRAQVNRRDTLPSV